MAKPTTNLNTATDRYEADCQDSLEASNRRAHLAFQALHAVYHERDFRVRCNDVIIAMVKRVLTEAVGGPRGDGQRCTACAAGFDYDDVWAALMRIRGEEVDGGR